MLKIDNLSYSKGFKKILKNINLTIYDKSLTIICGENGCGKTTLLKIICQAIRSKKIINNFNNIFYLSDKFQLPRNQYVFDFLLNASVSFKNSIDLKKMLNELELPNKLIKELSKGNYKKVAILYSFITNFDLLIYDEILDGLSPNIVKVIIRYIKNTTKTLIIVTHFLSAFRYLNYNLIKIQKGEIVDVKNHK